MIQRMLFVLCLAGAALHAENLINVDSDGIALHGYDPVAYVSITQAVKGRSHLDAPYAGATFLFATDNDRAAFQKNPKAYLPAYGGWCAYAMAEGDFVDVNPKTFKLISGTAHLFYNGFLGNTMKKWDKDEAKLKAAADAQWKKLVDAKQAEAKKP
jgi:YHS domain-containing protein